MIRDRVTRAIDWLVGLASPRRAVVRQHFRRMERDEKYRESVLLGLRARGYRNAKFNAEDTPFAWSLGSADFETSISNPTLRSRARELNRDDPIASGATDTFAREVVGTELRPQSQAEDEDVAAACEAVFAERRPFLTPTDPVPFGQWQRTLLRKALEDGDVFPKRAIAKSGEPVWFELVEADRVDTPANAKPADSKGEIKDGVEKDRLGRVVAYWVSAKHPGDAIRLGSGSSNDYTRVPIGGVKPIMLADRPGQSRGVTFFHAVLQDLRDLDLLLVASLKRAQVAACFSAFITSENQVPDLLEATAQDYGYSLDEDMVPGAMMKLLPGEKVEFANPNFPVPELEPFITMLARRIGAALGVSWHTILRDMGDLNYSSARTQILADRPTISILRTLVVEVLNWIWLTVLEDAQLRGDARLRGVSKEDLAAVRWIGDAKDWVDPLKEATATEIKLKMRIVTKADLCAEQGKDWEDQLKQSLLEEQRELELRAEMGLPAPVTDPGQSPSAPSAADQIAAEDAVAAGGRGFREVA